MGAYTFSRRRALLSAFAIAQPWMFGAALAAEAADVQGRAGSSVRLATAWRTSSSPGVPPDRVGVLEIDWAAAQVRIASDVPVPGRAHGLLALADGGFLAVANRPGAWLLRCDASGQVQQRLSIDYERPRRTFNGHVETSGESGPGRTADWLYTTETDPGTGDSWLSVRDARTLARVSQCPAGGRDAHQFLRARDGSLLVAIGGIVRDREGRKIEAERMAPSLVHLAPGPGRVLGQWQLDDPRLSIRHLAWAREAGGALANELGGALRLGLALQAEHDEEDRRRNAPTLAVWDGASLRIATADAGAGGYAGDIAAGPRGGFIISAQKSRRGLWWHAARPERLTPVAEITEPCGLAAVDDGDGVLISAGRGVARWHAREAPAMLPWPVALAPDNHWVVLRGG
jgi:hypothetical protein